MSQINQFVKQVETFVSLFPTIYEEIQKIQSTTVDQLGDWREFEARQEKVQKYITEITHVQEESGTKLLEKLKQVDPVTKESRYGLQTQQKFRSAYEKLQETIDNITPLFTQEYSHYLLIQQLYIEKSTTIDLKTKKEIEENELLNALEEQKRKEEEEEQSRKRKHQEEENEQRLHEQAELIRKKKLEEVQRIQSLSDQIDSTLREKILFLNQQLFYQKEIIPQYAGLIKSFCQENTTQFPIRGVKQMVIENIFNRIIGKPDDVNARKLRVNHPVLQKKLTLVRGAIQMLIIAGFELRLRPQVKAPTSTTIIPITNKSEHVTVETEEPSLITTDNKSQYEQALLTLQRLKLTDDLLPIFSPLLSPHTNWELFLEMDEPAIDDIITAPSSEVIDPKKLSWIDWYDALKEYSELIQREL